MIRKPNVYFPKVYLLNKHNNDKEKLTLPQVYNVSFANKDIVNGKIALSKQCRKNSVIRNYELTTKKLRIYLDSTSKSSNE